MAESNTTKKQLSFIPLLGSDPIKLVNFTNLSLTEKKMVLAWRNHASIKQWMYNQEDILEEEHLNFIESLRYKEDKRYFLVKKDSENIGVIDFTKIDKEDSSVYFGLYANPHIKLAGIGRVLEEISIDYAFNHLKLNSLKLEVFDTNIQVKNLHKKYNFKESGIKTINHKKVICMELKNENR